jgi:hypothetical protein
LLALLILSIRATCPTHIILFDFILGSQLSTLLK